MSLDPQLALGPGPHTLVRRLAERARYDRATVQAILDEAWMCHLASCEDGWPSVLPMLYVREGDFLYLHGAPANHSLRSAEAATAACVTVTLVDGLVLARSAFHHSVNYRSVVAFGTAREVTDVGEKKRAFLALVDHVVPGRARDARPPTPEEIRATRLTKFEIEEASAKIRTGGPKEEPEDLALAIAGGRPIWAGQLPLSVVAGKPVPDDQGPLPPEVPDYVARYGQRA